MRAADVSGEPAAASPRPPSWLIAATGLLALGVLAMAVAETNLWMHYLIDAGESISLVGLAFITVAGIYLYRNQRLSASLPLALPWLLFPVITQGDQLIDNLSINWMRLVVHVLLAAIFGIPVAVLVLAARFAVGPRPGAPARRWLAGIPGLSQLAAGNVRQGSALLAAMLLGVEMWVATRFLGELMVITLIVLLWAALLWGFRPAAAVSKQRSERTALTALLVGVAVSVGLFVGYKNRPGAYQGSPSYFMDPAQKDAGFRLDATPVPPGPLTLPADPEPVRAALTGYGQAFDRLLAGYYILDRNYNYDFHNRLFLRSTPLLANYRSVGLQDVHEAEGMRAAADDAAARARQSLGPDNPLAALLDDVHAYAAFTFGRAPLLESMSAEFVKTEAGLQHATHLYEGEGKVLGVRLAEIVEKHRAVLDAPDARPLTAEFLARSRSVHDLYANRIVGF